MVLRLYVEPVVFALIWIKGEFGLTARKIFEKTRLHEIEVYTSILSDSTFFGALKNMLNKGEIDEQTFVQYLYEQAKLERTLGSSLKKVAPEEKIQKICTEYIIYRNIGSEMAWHLATARSIECNMYVMFNENFDLNKKLWNNFKIFNIAFEKDVNELLAEIEKD